MEKHSKTRKIQNIIGIASAIALVVVFLISSIHSHFFVKALSYQTETPKDVGYFEFSGDLFYDGSQDLDLLSGVYADDGKGNDVTHTVNATITGDGTLTKKVVRYTFFDANNKSVTQTRNLIMDNYTGPSIKVSTNIKITADDLDDIINVLQKNGWLSADDGYGNDITDTVSCLRELVSEDKYKLTFHVVNKFADAKSVSVQAEISGNVENPVLRLTNNEIVIRVGDSIDPYNYIESAEDGASSVVTNVKVESTVNTNQAGSYKIVYKLYSPDKTALTTKVLRVRVE